ncbi:MAG: hypothetical protein ACI89L_000421 [Phycisphaerales bacterium]
MSEPNTPNTPEQASASSPGPTPLVGGVRVCVLLVSAAHVVTVLAGLWLAVLASGQVLWTSVGFELVALGAGIVGVLAGLGRLRQGVGLALLCVAGAVIVSGVFGLRYAAGPTLNSATLTGEASASAASVLQAVVRARVLLAAALAGLAALAVLTRSRAVWRPLGLGLALLVPMLGIGAWLIRFNGAARLVGEIETGLGVARLIAVLFGGLVLFVIASIGGHYVIKAFELTSAEPNSDDAATS